MKYLLMVLLIFTLVCSGGSVYAVETVEWVIPDQALIVMSVTAIIAITTHAPTDTGSTEDPADPMP